MSKEFKVWPWDFDEEPYWTNPENNIMWYVDRDLTDNCKRKWNSYKPLKAVCFILAKKESDEIKPITRVLLDHETSQPLAEHTRLEDMAVKIDQIRLVRNLN